MNTHPTRNFTIRLDSQLKTEAENLFASLGMNLSTAFNIFLHQAVQEQGLPFAVKRKIPNKVTLAAMQEAIELANNPNAPTYDTVDELFEDMNNDL